MWRAALTLGVFAVLAAWADAQAPGRLAADDQIRLFRANRALLAALVERGVELGATDDPAARAEACQRAARDLRVWGLEPAAAADDPHRVAEVGGHLEAVIRDGLLPNLEDGRKLYPPESRHAGKLAEYRRRAAGDLAEARATLGERPGVAADPRVKDLRDRLDALTERLK